MEDSSKPEEVLFEAALQRPAGERAAYLKAACGDDAKLYNRLTELLDAHEQGGDFLGEAACTSPFAEITSSRAPEQAVGDRVGPYKLLEKIGEGGCGVVYMAEQEQPIRRRVALKIIKLGMDTRSVIARFEAERQALAMMDHPNIAKVFDAGATQSGRPYFVMELVRGVRITQYCDENQVSTAQRLDLFIQVCNAIQHAHHKGIIHRDIKPSNILVTLHDGAPVPKVIDFGVAKATQGRLTDHTLFTAFEQFIGTPAYMSPEQASMTDQDVDTRSDIYSLGVLLYELLTGCQPFDSKELIKTGIDAMRKRIREDEPPVPSVRLSTLAPDSITTTSKQRLADPRKLMNLVRGDLDWIVMKCLEKDRTRRYVTANDLTADIHRHMAHEPILARAPTGAYRFRKWVTRHKVAFATISIVLCTILLGGTISIWQAVRATRVEAIATVQRDRADRAATQERQAKEEAIAAENRAMVTLADMHVSRGITSNASPITSSLWFAKAATITPNDPHRVESNLIRANNWLARSWIPVAAVIQHRVHADELIFNPKDPRYLLARGRTQSLEGGCQIWDLAREEAVQLPSDYKMPIAAAWTPEGQLVLATAEGKIALISLADANILRHWETEQSVNALAVSADGQLLAAAVKNRLIVWSLVGAGTTEPAIETYPANVVYIDFAPKGDRIVTASDDDRARIFSVDLTKNERVILTEAFAPVRHVIRKLPGLRAVIVPLFMDAGRVIVTLDQEGNNTTPGQMIWRDTESGRELASVSTRAGGTAGLSAMEVAPDGKFLLASTSGALRRYDSTGQIGGSYEGTFNVFAVSFNPLRSFVAAGDTAGVLNIYRINSGVKGILPPAWSTRLTLFNAIAFSTDGQLLAIGGVDGLIRVWKLPLDWLTSVHVKTLKYDGANSTLDFSPDGRFAAPVGIFDGNAKVRSIQVYTVEDGKPVGAKLELDADLLEAEFSPDGKMIAAVTGLNSDRKLLRVWDWGSGKQLCAYDLPDLTGGIAYASDGKSVAVHCFDGQLLFIDPLSGSLQMRCLGLPRELLGSLNVPTIHFSRDGRTIYSIGSSALQAWDTTTGLLRYSIQLGARCDKLSESRDGKVLATAAADLTLQFWRAADGHELSPPLQQTNGISTMIFSPDGTTLVTCARDQQVRIWEVASAKLIRTIDASSADDIAVTQDGRGLITTGRLSPQLSITRIWDPAMGFPLTPVLEVTGGAYHAEVKVSVDGNWAAIGGSGLDHGVLMDLRELTSTGGKTPQDTLLWAELVCCERVENVNVAILTSEEWFDRWHQFRSRHPEYRPFEN